MILRTIWVAEIGDVKDFKTIKKIAEKHHGKYHVKFGHVFSAAFVFAKQEDAEAFEEQCFRRDLISEE